MGIWDEYKEFLKSSQNSERRGQIPEAYKNSES